MCGLYRFAHIDGRIGSNPAQYVRRPKVHPSQGHGMDRTELGRFLFTAEQLGRRRAALAVLLGLNGLRVSEACETDIGDLGFDRGHRTPHTPDPRHRPTSLPGYRSCREPHAPSISPSVNDVRDRSSSATTANVSTLAPHIGG